MKYNFSEIIYHVLGYWKWFAEINDSTPHGYDDFKEKNNVQILKVRIN